MEDGHTILLVQPTADKISRTYFDFNTLDDALKGISTLFENTLRDLNVGMGNLTYIFSDLLHYVDSLEDLSVLVLDAKVNKYTPYGKAFLKHRLYQHFQSRAMTQ